MTLSRTSRRKASASDDGWSWFQRLLDGTHYGVRSRLARSEAQLAHESRMRVAHVRRTVDHKRELERMRLLNAALIRLLVQRGLITQAELDAMADAIDLEDGVRDGQMRPAAPSRHIRLVPDPDSPSPNPSH